MNNFLIPENLNSDIYSKPFEGDGVILISPDRRVMSANLQAEKILMVRLNPGQSFNISNKLTGEGLKTLEGTLEAAFLLGNSRENLEATISHRTGTYITLIFSVNPGRLPVPHCQIHPGQVR